MDEEAPKAAVYSSLQAQAARALTVTEEGDQQHKSFLVRGVNSDRIQTVSYGKEHRSARKTAKPAGSRIVAITWLSGANSNRAAARELLSTSRRPHSSHLDFENGRRVFFSRDTLQPLSDATPNTAL